MLVCGSNVGFSTLQAGILVDVKGTSQALGTAPGSLNEGRWFVVVGSGILQKCYLLEQVKQLQHTKSHKILIVVSIHTDCPF